MGSVVVNRTLAYAKVTNQDKLQDQDEAWLRSCATQVTNSSHPRLQAPSIGASHKFYAFSLHTLRQRICWQKCMFALFHLTAWLNGVAAQELSTEVARRQTATLRPEPGSAEAGLPLHERQQRLR